MLRGCLWLLCVLSLAHASQDRTTLRDVLRNRNHATDRVSGWDELLQHTQDLAARSQDLLLRAWGRLRSGKPQRSAVNERMKDQDQDQDQYPKHSGPNPSSIQHKGRLPYNPKQTSHTKADCASFPRSTPWQSKYGRCDAYAEPPLSYFCHIDVDHLVTGAVVADDACPQCGQCDAPIPPEPRITAIYSHTNAPTSTITIQFDQSISDFDATDVLLTDDGTGAQLASVTQTRNFATDGYDAFRVVVDSASDLGTFSIGISPDSDATGNDGQLIALGTPAVVTVDYCSSHYDCGHNRYCFGCKQCIEQYGQSVCGNCVEPIEGTGQCSSLVACYRDGDSIDGFCDEPVNPCECSNNGVSGFVSTGRIGCASWEDYLAPICYVASPDRCDGNMTVSSLGGAAWRYCDPNPNPGECPVGQCQQDGEGNCELFRDGYRCTVTDCSEVPDWAVCRQLNSVLFYGFDPRQDLDVNFDCNGGIVKPGVGDKFVCDGTTAVRRSGYDSAHCNRTEVVIDVCVCPVDYTGLQCINPRVLQCAMETNDQRCDHSSAAPTVHDYQEYDWRLPGEPMCVAADCATDVLPIEGIVTCAMSGTVDVDAFLGDSGVTREDYDDAMDELESSYALNSPDLKLSSDPRLYAAFEAFNLNRPFSSTVQLGHGIAMTSINADSESFVDIDLAALYEHRQLVSAGRMYIEAGLNSLSGVLASSPRGSIHVDCSGEEFNAKESSYSAGEAVGIAIVVVLIVLGMAAAVWRWRMVQ